MATATVEKELSDRLVPRSGAGMHEMTSEQLVVRLKASAEAGHELSSESGLDNFI